MLPLLLALLLAACGAPAPAGDAGSSLSSQATASPQSVASPPVGASPQALTRVTLGLTYKPDVQFAPFYLAAQRGYYREEGLDVQFQHLADADLLKLLGAGRLQYAVAGGDEMLVARSQGAPLVYVAAYFHKYPVALVSKKEAGITEVAQLRGKSVGVPGPFGATYTGLKALLYSAGLTERDVQVRSIGFTQVQALQRGQADAVMGYANNEPVQLERLGVPVNTIPVWREANLVSNGIITNEEHLAANPEQVGALVRATMRGLRDAVNGPEAALDASLKYVPEAGGPNREGSLAVLRASVDLWRNELSRTNGLGYTDPAAWAATRDFLRRAGSPGEDVDLQGAYTNRFVSKDVSAER